MFTSKHPSSGKYVTCWVSSPVDIGGTPAASIYPNCVLITKKMRLETILYLSVYGKQVRSYIRITWSDSVNSDSGSFITLIYQNKKMARSGYCRFITKLLPYLKVLTKSEIWQNLTTAKFR